MEGRSHPRRRRRDETPETRKAAPLSENYADELRWAKANLPDEHAPFVAVAARMLKRSGTKPTAENVKARLAAQGRTKAQLS